MTWFRSISNFEAFIILAFIVFYLVYIARMYNIAKKLRTGWRSVFIKLFLRSSYVLLIIIALLGPSFGEFKREVSSVGKDIMICIDLSESMNAFDIQPSRLERLKFELKNLANAFSSDRIGLIIFSHEAFMQCPLTYDQGAIHMFIEALSTHLVPTAGTDFGPPLQMAMEKMMESSEGSGSISSKIILLISDGEDFGDNTQQIAQKIADSGIRLFALGIGTEDGSRIRTSSGFKTDREGREVITRLNSKDMRNLAVKTGGKYFEINESKNDIQRLINSINQIEGEVRDARVVDATANKYYYFLAAALLLIAFDVLLRVKTLRI